MRKYANNYWQNFWFRNKKSRIAIIIIIIQSPGYPECTGHGVLNYILYILIVIITIIA
jgi:hypothetical protein